jgi:hypothetical protein
MKLRIVLFILMILSAGCESKEKTLATTANKAMQTFCIGRHSLDLPTGFEPLIGIGAIFRPVGTNEDGSSMDVSISAIGITQAKFAAIVQDRRAELAAAGSDTTNIFKEMKRLGENAVLFRVLKINDSYMSELHLLTGENYMSIATNSYDGHFAEAEARLVTFAANVELAKAPTDPQPGFCLGPVVIKGQYQEEYARLRFQDRKRPDVVFAVAVDTYARDESVTLLQRVSGPDSLLKKFDARNVVLREGELKVAGMRAQEWLSWIMLGENGDKKHFGFALETMRPNPSPAQPHIHINLDTGQYDRDGNEQANSLTDQEAVALWDAVVKTIRLRPVATH